MPSACSLEHPQTALAPRVYRWGIEAPSSLSCPDHSPWEPSSLGPWGRSRVGSEAPESGPEVAPGLWRQPLPSPGPCTPVPQRPSLLRAEIAGSAYPDSSWTTGFTFPTLTWSGRAWAVPGASAEWQVLGALPLTI